MTIYKAIAELVREYDKVKEQDWIVNPVAYALYQVWKRADKEKQNETD